MKKTQLIKIVQLINNSVKSFSWERLYIATKTLKWSKIEFEFSKKVDYENKPSRANQEVEVWDIIFAKMQWTRKTLLIWKSEKEYIFSSWFFVLRASKEILNEYLFHFLNSESFLNQKDINCTWATQKALTLTWLKKIFIPLPPLPQQKQIIKKLDKLTNLIELRKESIRKTEDLTKSIFIEMFGDPMLNEKGWGIKSLWDSCNFIKDWPHKSLNYIKKGIPFISVNTIIKWYWDFSNVKYISKEDYDFYSKRCKPEYWDILYTKWGTTWFAKFFDLDIECLNWVHLAVLKFDKEILNWKFLESMLNTDFCYIQSQRYTRWIANRDLVLWQMALIKIIFPPITLQNKFAEIVKKNEENIRWQKESLGKLEELYDSCMQESFNF